MTILSWRDAIAIALIIMVIVSSQFLPKSKCVLNCDQCNGTEMCVNYISAFCPYGCVEYKSYWVSTTEFPKECKIICQDYNFTMNIDVSPKYEEMYIPFNPTVDNNCTVIC